MARIDSIVESTSMSRRASGPRRDLLEDRIRDGLTGCVAEQTAIALQIARALQCMHRNGRFHGRISSSTIFLDEQNQATFDGEPGTDSFLTSADIRGLGRVLYELLAGRIIENEKEIDVEHLYKAGITPHLVEVVRRCLSAEEQPRDVSYCVKELEELLREMLGQPAAFEVNRVLIGAGLVVSLVAAALWMMLR
jgi:hypothetical protein